MGSCAVRFSVECILAGQCASPQVKEVGKLAKFYNLTQGEAQSSEESEIASSAGDFAVAEEVRPGMAASSGEYGCTTVKGKADKKPTVADSDAESGYSSMATKGFQASGIETPSSGRAAQKHHVGCKSDIWPEVAKSCEDGPFLSGKAKRKKSGGGAGGGRPPDIENEQKKAGFTDVAQYLTGMMVCSKSKSDSWRGEVVGYDKNDETLFIRVPGRKATVYAGLGEILVS